MLGPVAAAMAKARPVTVRVVVPGEARALLFRPLELAHAGGRPLSLQDVTLVMQAGEDGDGAVLWAAIGIGPLLGDLVAAASGDTSAAGRASQVLEAMAGDPDWAALAEVLRRVLGGDRDPGLAERVEDPVSRAVVETVLGHIGAG